MWRNNGRNQESKKAKIRYKAYKQQKKSNVPIVIIVCIVIGLLILGGVMWFAKDETQESATQFQEGDLSIEKTIQSQEEVEEPITEEVTTEEAVSEELSEEEIDEIVEEYLDSMNIEARVGQLFIIPPEELTGIGIAVQASETTKTMLKTYNVGGLLFAEQNFEVQDQMQLMVSNIKVYSNYPIFMAMDEEGALRITNTKNTLEGTGFNLASIDSELYLITENGNENLSQWLNVVYLESSNIIQVLEEGADMFIVEDDFETTYNTLVSAVRSGEFDESLLEEKVRKILTYKVENGI